jgi:hypothetical protein
LTMRWWPPHPGGRLDCVGRTRSSWSSLKVILNRSYPETKRFMPRYTPISPPHLDHSQRWADDLDLYKVYKYARRSTSRPSSFATSSQSLYYSLTSTITESCHRPNSV